MIPPSQACRWLNLEGGVPPVHEPPDPESCRDWIRERDRARDAVLILGGGGQWFLGNDPERATHILSVRRWDPDPGPQPRRSDGERRGGLSPGTTPGNSGRDGTVPPFSSSQLSARHRRRGRGHGSGRTLRPGDGRDEGVPHRHRDSARRRPTQPRRRASGQERGGIRPVQALRRIHGDPGNHHSRHVQGPSAPLLFPGPDYWNSTT